MPITTNCGFGDLCAARLYRDVLEYLLSMEAEQRGEKTFSKGLVLTPHEFPQILSVVLFQSSVYTCKGTLAPDSSRPIVMYWQPRFTVNCTYDEIGEYR